jgi:diguanylate cyclase (GGDEF)-like protein
MRTRHPFFPLFLLAAPCAAAPGLAAQRPSAAQLVEEAARVEHSDPAATLRLTRQALPSLRSPGDAPLRMRALVLRCWAAASEVPDSLRPYAESGLADAVRTGDGRAIASLRTCRGYAHQDAGRFREAAIDYDSAEALARRLDAAKERAEAMMLRGELRYYRGEYNGAIADLGTAHRLFTAVHDTAQQRYVLNAIANLYADSRVAQYDRALEYYRQVLASHESAGNLRGIATSYYNLGSTLQRMGKLEEALAHFRRGLAIDRRRNDPAEVATDQRAIGEVLYKLGRPGEALPVLDQSLAYFRRAGDEESTAQVRLTRGVALRMLGRTGEALADLEVARQRYASTGNRRFLEKVHEERALAFAAAGDWRQAYQARTEQLALQRELSERGREEQTSRLRVQFDAEKKERDNRALQRENDLRGQALAAGARVRRLQAAVLVLTAIVIAALALLVTRQLKASRRLRITSLTDELTCLPNRRHLLMVADEQVKAARARGTGFGVLALDIDHFKRINDGLGHDVGDAVLRKVAAALEASLREGDHVGRTGGEEFVAILPGAAAGNAAEAAERVRRAVEQAPFGELHPTLSVSVSVGATVWHPRDGSFAATWKRADEQLYRAKAAGRNRVEVDAALS